MSRYVYDLTQAEQSLVPTVKPNLIRSATSAHHQFLSTEILMWTIYTTESCNPSFQQMCHTCTISLPENHHKLKCLKSLLSRFFYWFFFTRLWITTLALQIRILQKGHLADQYRVQVTCTKDHWRQNQGWNFHRYCLRNYEERGKNDAWLAHTPSKQQLFTLIQRWTNGWWKPTFAAEMICLAALWVRNCTLDTRWAGSAEASDCSVW